ncbi:MAG: hypothetical protein AAGJ46_17660 [Planctomycetota bacterium]
MALRALLPIVLAACGTSCGLAETLYTPPDLYSLATERSPDPSAAAVQRQLAEKAVEEGDPAAAFRFASTAVWLDSGDEVCQRILGYERVDGQWLSPYQKRQVSRGYAWDARFGWIKSADLARYEAGERRYGRRWLSAADAARVRKTRGEDWRVRTDHWVVTTPHSLEAAATLAAELERLFQLWRQVFGGYAVEAKDLRPQWRGDRPPRAWARPLQVTFHASKQAYVNALRHKQPRIAETAGIYFDDLREAHFFADESRVDGPPSAFRLSPSTLPTLYHEATHQLFQESRRTRKNVGAYGSFWLVEGVATAMESLTPLGDGRYAFAEPGGGRLPDARRRLAEGYSTPLAELHGLGSRDLQRRDDLPALYSQMAGLGTFLLSADDGRRRPGVVAFLRRLYADRLPGRTLWEEIGEGPADAQRAYQRWLQTAPADDR